MHKGVFHLVLHITIDVVGRWFS